MFFFSLYLLIFLLVLTLLYLDTGVELHENDGLDNSYRFVLMRLFAICWILLFIFSRLSQRYFIAYALDADFFRIFFIILSFVIVPLIIIFLCYVLLFPKTLLKLRALFNRIYYDSFSDLLFYAIRRYTWARPLFLAVADYYPLSLFSRCVFVFLFFFLPYFILNLVFLMDVFYFHIIFYSFYCFYFLTISFLFSLWTQLVLKSHIYTYATLNDLLALIGTDIPTFTNNLPLSPDFYIRYKDAFLPCTPYDIIEIYNSIPAVMRPFNSFYLYFSYFRVLIIVLTLFNVFLSFYVYFFFILFP